MDNLHTIEPNLIGDTSKLEVDASELNTAAALAALSMKMLDAMANIYQLHTTVVRLGQNIDMTYGNLTSAVNDLKGQIMELKMRVEDLEALQITDLGNNGG